MCVKCEVCTGFIDELIDTCSTYAKYTRVYLIRAFPSARVLKFTSSGVLGAVTARQSACELKRCSLLFCDAVTTNPAYTHYDDGVPCHFSLCSDKPLPRYKL